MRIGIIHGKFEALGGSEKVAISLIKCLKKEGHEIDLYFTNTTSNKIIENVFGDLLAGVKLHKVFQLKMPGFGIYRNLLNRTLLTKAGNRDDIVIETCGSLIPKWFTNKPYIAYCNGLSVVSSQNNKVSGWKKLYSYPYAKLDSLMHSKIKHVTIVSNSQFTRELVKKILGVDSQVIYPPVELNLFKCKPLPKDNRVVVFGRFALEKNYELAISLAELLDTQFIFIGSVGDRQYYDRLIQSITRKGLDQRIKIISNAPMADVVQILSCSKVYLHCRYDEPFGITVVEAIAAGCIPIVPDNSAHKETVPFEELRYKENDVNKAREKLANAIEGKYDHYLPKLRLHIKQFDVKEFQSKMIECINNFS